MIGVSYDFLRHILEEQVPTSPKSETPGRKKKQSSRKIETNKESSIVSDIHVTVYPWAVYCKGPPSFIWGGGGGREGEEGWAKKEAILFQSTIDMHIQMHAKAQQDA